jgi:hypothetical protein
MHAVMGLILGSIASLPANDLVVTLCAASMFGVGAAITGFILSEVARAR